MATVDSIQDFHAQLDLVCTSLEKLSAICTQDHQDYIDAAEPAMILFRQLLDLGDQLGFAR